MDKSVDRVHGVVDLLRARGHRCSPTVAEGVRVMR
jgi:hypothetical protein